MALIGNTITCDGYGCCTEDTFEGDLSPEDILVRYEVLGWRYTVTDERELHHCPEHF